MRNEHDDGSAQAPLNWLGFLASNHRVGDDFMCSVEELPLQERVPKRLSPVDQQMGAAAKEKSDFLKIRAKKGLPKNESKI